MNQINVIPLIAISVIMMACSKAPPATSAENGVALDPTKRPLPIRAKEMAPSHGASDLPALGQPLAEVERDLLKRASEGNPLASCRLAAEYDFCAGIRQQLTNLEATKIRAVQNVAYYAPRRSTNAETPYLGDGFVNHVREIAKHCQGVSLPSPSQRIRHWRAAAMSGHLPSMVTYSSGRVFSGYDTLQNLAELQTYKNEAVEIANKAAQLGSLDAMLTLAISHTPREINQIGRHLLAQLVTPDAAAALTFYLQAQSLIKSTSGEEAEVLAERLEWDISNLIARLPETAVNQARIEAARRNASIPRLEPAMDRSLRELQENGVSTGEDIRLCSVANFGN